MASVVQRRDGAMASDAAETSQHTAAPNPFKRVPPRGLSVSVCSLCLAQQREKQHTNKQSFRAVSRTQDTIAPFIQVGANMQHSISSEPMRLVQPFIFCMLGLRVTLCPSG